MQWFTTQLRKSPQNKSLKKSVKKKAVIQRKWLKEALQMSFEASNKLRSGIEKKEIPNHIKIYQISL